MRFCIISLLLVISNFCKAQVNVPCSNWLNLPSYPSYVEIGDLDVPGNKITVEAWITRTTPYTGGFNWAGDVVSKHEGPNDANYLLRPNNAEITTANGYFSTPPVCQIELNKTYHVALVYDGSRLKFYRNGFLMSSVAATGNLFQNKHPTRIGLYDGNKYKTNLIGYVNEVRIWNVARSQAQIRATMGSSLSTPSTLTGLLAYYSFDNLQNKQGNAAWDGVLSSTAKINQTIPICAFKIDSCGIPRDLETVVLVTGNVYNSKTKQPISASIVYQTLPGGTEVGNAASSPVDGSFKISLPLGKNYLIRATADQFFAQSENLNLDSFVKKGSEFIHKDLYLVPIEIGLVVRLNNVFFDFDKWELRPESYAELDRVVKLLFENPAIEIEMSAHTDSYGSNEYNEVLSGNRAKSVMDYIISKGIATSRIISQGYGETKPVAPNDTPENRQLNRRVEFKILKN